jgi:hypothetical protein
MGIGRNQYIDLMNQGRIKSKFSFRRRNVKELLPKKPIMLQSIDWWWVVHIGHVTEDDIKMCNAAEHRAVDTLIDCGPQKAGQLELKVVQGLYSKGLVYMEVPINDDDYIAGKYCIVLVCYVNEGTACLYDVCFLSTLSRQGGYAMKLDACCFPECMLTL